MELREPDVFIIGAIVGISKGYLFSVMLVVFATDSLASINTAALVTWAFCVVFTYYYLCIAVADCILLSDSEQPPKAWTVALWIGLGEYSIELLIWPFTPGTTFPSYGRVCLGAGVFALLLYLFSRHCVVAKRLGHPARYQKVSMLLARVHAGAIFIVLMACISENAVAILVAMVGFLFFQIHGDLGQLGAARARTWRCRNCSCLNRFPNRLDVVMPTVKTSCRSCHGLAFSPLLFRVED